MHSTIKLGRCILPFIIKYYLPCIAIITVSLINFLISVSSIPARVALLVTQFLTLTNILIAQQVIIRTVFFHKLSYSLINFSMLNVPSIMLNTMYVCILGGVALVRTNYRAWGLLVNKLILCCNWIGWVCICLVFTPIQRKTPNQKHLRGLPDGGEPREHLTKWKWQHCLS